MTPSALDVIPVQTWFRMTGADEQALNEGKASLEAFGRFSTDVHGEFNLFADPWERVDDFTPLILAEKDGKWFITYETSVDRLMTDPELSDFWVD